MKRIISFLLLAVLTASMCIHIQAADMEENDYGITSESVSNELYRRMHEKMETLYSGTIEYNDTVYITFPEETPEESATIAIQAEKLKAHELINYGLDIEGGEIGEILRLTPYFSEKPIYLIVDHVERDLDYSDETAKILSNGTCDDILEYEEIVRNELIAHKKEILQKEADVRTVCEELLSSAGISGKVTDISAWVDTDRYESSTIRFLVNEDKAFDIHDFSGVAESLFSQMNELECIICADALDGSICGFFVKSMVDGRILNSESMDDELTEEDLTELLYSIRIRDEIEEWDTGKADAAFYVMDRLHLIPEMEYNYQFDYNLWTQRTFINVNFTHDLTHEQLNLLPVIGNILLALTSDTTIVTFSYPPSENPTNDQIYEVSWNNYKAEGVLFLQKTDAYLDSLNAFEMLINESKMLDLERYFGRHYEFVKTDRTYVADYLTPKEDAISADEMTEEQVTRLVNIIQECRDFEIEGVTIFHSDVESRYDALVKAGADREELEKYANIYLQTSNYLFWIEEEEMYVDNLQKLNITKPEKMKFYIGQTEDEVYKNLGISREQFRLLQGEHECAAGNVSMILSGDGSNWACIEISQHDELLGNIRLTISIDQEGNDWKVTDLMIDNF